MIGGGGRPDASLEAREPVALHDQALWRDLTGATDARQFGEAWLALVCRMIPGATAGVLLLEQAGALAPVAGAPADGAADPAQIAAAQLAATERRGVLQAPPTGSTAQPTRLAY